MDTLGEDLVLLYIRPASGRLKARHRLEYGLMGSELIRLAGHGRIEFHGGRIVVIDAAPTGDAQLDTALRSLARSAATGTSEVLPAPLPERNTARLSRPARGVRHGTPPVRMDHWDQVVDRRPGSSGRRQGAPRCHRALARADRSRPGGLWQHCRGDRAAALALWRAWCAAGAQADVTGGTRPVDRCGHDRGRRP